MLDQLWDAITGSKYTNFSDLVVDINPSCSYYRAFNKLSKYDLQVLENVNQYPVIYSSPNLNLKISGDRIQTTCFLQIL